MIWKITWVIIWQLYVLGSIHSRAIYVYSRYAVATIRFIREIRGRLKEQESWIGKKGAHQIFGLAEVVDLRWFSVNLRKSLVCYNLFS